MRNLTRTLMLLLVAMTTGPLLAQTNEPRGIEIRNLAPLAFGSFAAPPAAGQVTIAPDGSRMVSGVVPVGTSVFGAAQFEVRVRGQGNPNYVISLPASITLTSATGSMSIGQVTSLPSGKGTAKPPARIETLTVGGTLNISASQPAGSYTATFPVTVHLVN